MYRVKVYTSCAFPIPFVAQLFTWHNLTETALEYLLDGCYYDGDAHMFIKDGEHNGFSLGYALESV